MYQNMKKSHNDSIALSIAKKNKAAARVSLAERVEVRGIDATNSTSESLYASSTHGLKVWSTIRLDHCAAEGQTRSNNNFGRQHLSLVSGRQLQNKMNDKPMGAFIHWHLSCRKRPLWLQRRTRRAIKRTLIKL